MKLLELILSFALGAGVTVGYYKHNQSHLNARWEAVTGTTIEEAEQRVKACKPCRGVLATHRGKL